MCIQAIASRMQNKTYHLRLGIDRSMGRDEYKRLYGLWRNFMGMASKSYRSGKITLDEYGVCAAYAVEKCNYIVFDIISHKDMIEAMRSAVCPVVDRHGNISVADQVANNLKYGGR